MLQDFYGNQSPWSFTTLSPRQQPCLLLVKMARTTDYVSKHLDFINHSVLFDYFYLTFSIYIFLLLCRCPISHSFYHFIDHDWFFYSFSFAVFVFVSIAFFHSFYFTFFFLLLYFSLSIFFPTRHFCSNSYFLLHVVFF